LAVGRSDLLPLRGTANSPSTCVVYLPRASMPDGKRCEESLGLEKLAVGRSDLRPLCGTANSPSHLRGILCPGPLCLMANDVRSPWAWRNWLSVGATSSRFAAPPILPPTCVV
ncbi:MAG: hypothetical protein KHW59_09100, partial [Clostridiales bacterium]|nr:hypothetical protein [Clostridiales bacterium]